MTSATITQSDFLADRQGRTFLDVVNDPDCPFQEALEFFNDEHRLQRMQESEIHHDRAPLAGVVRELEAHSVINQFLAGDNVQQTKRFRQAVGVLVRIVMEKNGWQKTGRKGSLGVRATTPDKTPKHNTGGLAFWFLRAERYEHSEGMPFLSARERCKELEAAAPGQSQSKQQRPAQNGKRVRRT